MINVKCSDYVFQEVCNILSSRIFVGFHLTSLALENPPSVYLGNLANKFHLFEDLLMKFDESFDEAGFNKMTKLLSSIITQCRFLKSFTLNGLGEILHGEYVLSELVDNKTLVTRLRNLNLENRAWWGDAGDGWRNVQILAQFLSKVKALEIIDLSGNHFTNKQS